MTITPDDSYQVHGSAAATVTVTDDEPNLVSVLAAAESVAEGGAGTFRLRRKGNTADSLTVTVGEWEYPYPAWGLRLAASGRLLVTYEDRGYEEWGAGGSLRLAPGAAGRGPSLSVSTTWGEAASGVEQLWSQGAGSAGLAGNGVAAPAGRLAAELGYGMETAGGEGLVTPYAGVTLAAGCRPGLPAGRAAESRAVVQPRAGGSPPRERSGRPRARPQAERIPALVPARRPTTLQSLSWPGRQVYAGARGCRHSLPVHGARVPRTAVNCGREGTRTPGRRGGEPIPSSPLWDAREATRGVRRVAR